MYIARSLASPQFNAYKKDNGHDKAQFYTDLTSYVKKCKEEPFVMRDSSIMTKIEQSVPLEWKRKMTDPDAPMTFDEKIAYIYRQCLVGEEIEGLVSFLKMCYRQLLFV